MPSIKDIVAGQSVGVGKRVIKAGADKLRGIINDRTDKAPEKTPFSMTTLTYPMDVADDPRQGHYVMFTIREQSSGAKVDDKEEININKTDEDYSLEKASIAQKEFKTEYTGSGKFKITYINTIPEAGAGPVKGGITKDRIIGEDKRQKERRYIIRPPTIRTNTIITLYMPPQVKNITGVEFESTEMAPLSTALAAQIGASVRDDIDFGEGTTGLGKEIMKIIGGAMEAIGFGGMANQMQMGTGVALADRMEFVFKNPKKRAFPYQFDFYPKSKKEAQEVHSIIQTFRKHMLPKIFKVGIASMSGSPILHVPNEFNIEYYYKGTENNFLNKIGNCYLTDCDITYGGDRYSAFPTGKTKDGEPGASPTEIHMTLNFQEMDIITHEDVALGF